MGSCTCASPAGSDRQKKATPDQHGGHPARGGLDVSSASPDGAGPSLGSSVLVVIAPGSGLGLDSRPVLRRAGRDLVTRGALMLASQRRPTASKAYCPQTTAAALPPAATTLGRSLSALLKPEISSRVLSCRPLERCPYFKPSGNPVCLRGLLRHADTGGSAFMAAGRRVSLGVPLSSRTGPAEAAFFSHGTRGRHRGLRSPTGTEPLAVRGDCSDQPLVLGWRPEI